MTSSTKIKPITSISKVFSTNIRPMNTPFISILFPLYITMIAFLRATIFLFKNRMEIFICKSILIRRTIFSRMTLVITTTTSFLTPVNSFFTILTVCSSPPKRMRFWMFFSKFYMAIPASLFFRISRTKTFITIKTFCISAFEIMRKNSLKIFSLTRDGAKYSFLIVLPRYLESGIFLKRSIYNLIALKAWLQYIRMFSCRHILIHRNYCLYYSI